VIALPAFAQATGPAANVPAAAVPEANISVPPAKAQAQRRSSSTAPGLTVVPLHPVAGGAVRLQVLHAPAGTTDYRWHLVAGAKGVTDTGSSPSITHTYARPGGRHITVEMTTASGTRRLAISLTVVAPAAPTTRPPGTAPQPATGQPPTAPQPATGQPPTAPQPAAAPAPRPADHAETGQAQSAPRTPRVAHAVRAHAAGDPAVTIADFQFSPGSVTVHVGDTITWTNNGPSTHTATAHDGSFDTGQLKKGQSASHTFTHAGTVTYFCQIHPFMHGTVVVLTAPAAATSPTVPSSAAPAGTTTSPTTGSAESTGSSTPAPATTPAPVAHSALPVTGLDLTEGLAIGLVLLGVGLVLHRATRGAVR
jgi:plastocyanin